MRAGCQKQHPGTEVGFRQNEKTRESSSGAVRGFAEKWPPLQTQNSRTGEGWVMRLGVNVQGCNMFNCEGWGVDGECWGSMLFSRSVVSLFVTLQTTAWTLRLYGLHAWQASLSFTTSQSLLKLTSIESVVPSNHLILCHPHFCQSFPASGSFLVSRLFTSGSQSIGASASAVVLSMYIQDWFPLAFLAVQRTLKSLLQHHNSKASVLQFSAFFMVQLSHPYMITGKTTVWTIWIFVSQVMSLILIHYLGLS